MNSAANGSSRSWSCLNFTALKIGGIVTYCLIIIVSLVANSLIVILVCKTPNLKKPINYFIANMASTDLLYPLSWIPLSLSNLHTDSFLIVAQLGQALCKLVPFFDNVSFVVSTQNLILIAVDRFGAVVFLLRSPLIRSKLCLFFILATWVIAIVFFHQTCSPSSSLNTWREPGVYGNGREYSENPRPLPVSYYLTTLCLHTSLCCCWSFFTPSSLSRSRHRYTQVNRRPTISNNGKEETETFFKCPLLS
ncbi:unnamed protein product [Porites lobata]|uniref:G-protein coupled receptors family 1 profile domain-containing protein n=1 Tax=Porites lobata TaxID=104759 RepID=A0ABN8R601_9CNID|nr:unnamed protein product [Porites lobata]